MAGVWKGVMTKKEKEMQSWIDDAVELITLLRIHLHNKYFDEPELQNKESLFSYRERLRKAAFKKGYDEDDIIIM